MFVLQVSAHVFLYAPPAAGDAEAGRVPRLSAGTGSSSSLVDQKMLSLLSNDQQEIDPHLSRHCAKHLAPSLPSPRTVAHRQTWRSLHPLEHGRREKKQTGRAGSQACGRARCYATCGGSLHTRDDDLSWHGPRGHKIPLRLGQLATVLPSGYSAEARTQRQNEAPQTLPGSNRTFGPSLSCSRLVAASSAPVINEPSLEPVELPPG